MPDAVIVDALRTPVGWNRGAYADVHPVELGAHVRRALAERTGVDPALIDDVVWGCVSQVGEQSTNVSRGVVLGAGWPDSILATTVDRQCGSSQQAVHVAAVGIVAGHYDIDDIGAFEVNEAFASVPLAWLAETGADPAQPAGGAIFIGHPLGGSGGVLMTRLVHHMRDRSVRYGLQTMCAAGVKPTPRSSNRSEPHHGQCRTCPVGVVSMPFDSDCRAKGGDISCQRGRRRNDRD